MEGRLDTIGFHTSFPAIRAYQAGEAFYVVMCPMKLLTKLFSFDDEEVPPEVRAQRVLNKARLPEIARYTWRRRNAAAREYRRYTEGRLFCGHVGKTRSLFSLSLEKKPTN